MMNFNEFKRLNRIKDLPAQEQNRQYFVYQGDRMFEVSVMNSNAAAFSAAAAGGDTSRLAGNSTSDDCGFTYVAQENGNGILQENGKFLVI